MIKRTEKPYRDNCDKIINILLIFMIFCISLMTVGGVGLLAIQLSRESTAQKIETIDNTQEGEDITYEKMQVLCNMW